jgi:hypothetical protein
MIGFFSVFEAIEPQGNYMEEFYNLGEYKLTWMHVVTFLALHIYFIYQTCIFCNSHEIHLGTTVNSLL